MKKALQNKTLWGVLAVMAVVFLFDVLNRNLLQTILLVLAILFFVGLIAFYILDSKGKLL